MSLSVSRVTSLRLCAACRLGISANHWQSLYFWTCSLELIANSDWTFEPVGALPAMQHHNLSRRRDCEASTKLRNHCGAPCVVNPFCQRDHSKHHPCTSKRPCSSSCCTAFRSSGVSSQDQITVSIWPCVWQYRLTTSCLLLCKRCCEVSWCWHFH